MAPGCDCGRDDALTESAALDGNPSILSGRVDLGAHESVCGSIQDFDVEARENDSGGFDAMASIKTHLPDCPAGRVTVCVEGCGEALCREVDCP
ncbi:MAG: hypothetical protein IT449_17435 [Phycisphaerales bacterium]|nr:hypothetical protein [Phycisphaerales bacterium]